MAEWKRPDTVPYPSVWRTFEGQTGANGFKRKYWVQDLTDEYKDAFFYHMKTGFLKDEILSKYLHLSEDVPSVEGFVEVWEHVLRSKLALICLTRNENDELQIVGFNATGLSHKCEKFDPSIVKGEKLQGYMHLALYVTDLKDLFTELNINEYLTAAGLYVLPEFRGEGIGTEMLKARRELCLAVGIKASGTLFTSIISQKIAAKAGFKDLTEISYEDLEKIIPKLSFPGISEVTKTVKYMYIKYD